MVKYYKQIIGNTHYLTKAHIEELNSDIIAAHDIGYYDVYCNIQIINLKGLMFCTEIKRSLWYKTIRKINKFYNSNKRYLVKITINK